MSEWVGIIMQIHAFELIRTSSDLNSLHESFSSYLFDSITIE